MTTNVSAKCYIEDSDDEEDNIIINDIDLQKLDNNTTIKKLLNVVVQTVTINLKMM